MVRIGRAMGMPEGTQGTMTRSFDDFPWVKISR